MSPPETLRSSQPGNVIRMPRAGRSSFFIAAHYNTVPLSLIRAGASGQPAIRSVDEEEPTAGVFGD